MGLKEKVAAMVEKERAKAAFEQYDSAALRTVHKKLNSLFEYIQSHRKAFSEADPGEAAFLYHKGLTPIVELLMEVGEGMEGEIAPKFAEAMGKITVDSVIGV